MDLALKKMGSNSLVRVVIVVQVRADIKADNYRVLYITEILLRISALAMAGKKVQVDRTVFAVYHSLLPSPWKAAPNRFFTRDFDGIDGTSWKTPCAACAVSCQAVRLFVTMVTGVAGNPVEDSRKCVHFFLHSRIVSEIFQAWSAEVNAENVSEVIGSIPTEGDPFTVITLTCNNHTATIT